jgi:hypothetical protein
MPYRFPSIAFSLSLSVYRLLLFTGDRLLALNGYLRSLVAISVGYLSFIAILVTTKSLLLPSLVAILLSAVLPAVEAA